MPADLKPAPESSIRLRGLPGCPRRFMPDGRVADGAGDARLGFRLLALLGSEAKPNVAG